MGLAIRCGWLEPQEESNIKKSSSNVENFFMIKPSERLFHGMRLKSQGVIVLRAGRLRETGREYSETAGSPDFIQFQILFSDFFHGLTDAGRDLGCQKGSQTNSLPAESMGGTIIRLFPRGGDPCFCNACALFRSLSFFHP